MAVSCSFSAAAIKRLVFKESEINTAETEALREYTRVLGIFRDLVIYGKLPDEE